MAKIYINNDQDQNYDEIQSYLGLQFQEDSILKNLEPQLSEDYLQSQVQKNIMIIIMEMGYDMHLAKAILNSMDEIKTLDQNTILNKVISAISQIQDSQVEDQQYEIEHKFNIRQTFMSYLGQNSVRSSQQLLDQTCGICMEPINDQIIPEMDCGHNFCLSCMKEYLRQKIMNGQVDQMVCPQDDCKFQLNDDYLRQIVEPEMMIKLGKFRRVKQIQLDPDVIWCPRLGCENTLKKNGSKKLVCKCGQMICNKCGREKHKDKTCGDQIDKDFEKTIKLLKIQKCQKCKSPIQKNDGCNHMTCKTCQYEFCWLCRSKYSRHHYSSYNVFGCPGLQFTHKDPFKYPNLYRFLYILLILIFGPPLFIAALILGFIILVIGLPFIFYLNYVPCYQFKEYGCCRKIFIIIFFIIICPMASPISLLIVLLGIGVAIIVGIPYCIYLFIDWLRYG